MTTNLNNKFQLNGKNYKTDDETINVLRNAITRAKESGDASAVAAIITLGIITKKIVEIK